LTYKRVALFTACVFLTIAALVMRRDRLYFMAAVTLVIPLVAFIASRFSLRRVRLSRRCPARVFEGERFSADLVLENSGRLPRFFIRASDEMPEWVRAHPSSDFLVPTVWPGVTISLNYEAEPMKRGVFTWPGLRLGATDPCGIFGCHRRIAGQQELVVLPAPIPFEAEQFAGVRSLMGLETQHVGLAGRGLEFFGVREYQPGDEQRRIHWRSTARLSRLAVVEDQQTVAGDVEILLDLKAGSDVGIGKDTTLEYAVKIAASLARFATNSGASSALVCAPKERGPTVVRAAAEEELWNLLELLARVKADSDLSLIELMRNFQPGPGSSVFLITAAPEPALAPGLADWVSQDVKICVLLLDTSSFDDDAAVSRPPRRKQSDGFGQLLASLAAVGAAAHIVSRGDDLAALLRRATYAVS
jgi:uncharacterized protein (DUF58 family)